MRGDEVPPVGLGLTTTWVDRENAVLAVAGEIDIATADCLAQAISAILTAPRARRLCSTWPKSRSWTLAV